MGGRKALVVATYEYGDGGLRRLAAPGHDAEALADVLQDPGIADFDVTVLLNQPNHVVGEAVENFYADCRRDDLTLLYFSGHGLKDDEGRLYLAMANTRRDRLRSTALSAAQVNEAMDGCTSRRKVLVLDCCYSGAFPAGRTAKADDGVQTLERFQGKGRAVLTASDATQYAFEGDDLSGSGTSSVFTRYLVEAIRSGAADLDEDGDIALDELYSYVRDRVVAEMPQQRPKKQEDVDGRILIARNVHWRLPEHLRYAIDSPIAGQRLSSVEGLAHLYRRGNEIVRGAVEQEVARLADDDSRAVSAAAAAFQATLTPGGTTEPPAALPDHAEPPSAPARPRAPRTAIRPAMAAPQAPTAAPRGSAGRPAGSAVPDRSRPTTRLVPGLILLSALPLTLSRQLPIESSNPYTADGYLESTVPWTLAVVTPLALAAVLLALGNRLPAALAPARGLVLGPALVLTETSSYWGALLVQEKESYDPGPALWWLFAGWAVVAVAAVVVLTGSPPATRPTIAHDWRIGCALVVLAGVGAAMAAVWGADSPWVWIEDNTGLVLLGLSALALTLLRLDADQAVAGLVAVSVLGFWLVSYLVQDYRLQASGVDPPQRMTEIVCVVVAVALCYLAQADRALSYVRALRAPVHR